VRRKQTIRAIVGSFLLLIFLTGITPKRYWHDVFANHRDLASVVQTEDLQLSKAGFNCDWNSLVATSPFTETEEIIFPKPLLVYARHFLLPADRFYQPHLTYRSLRGPPAIA